MGNVILLLALLAAQAVRIERPPSTAYVVHATVPAPGPLRSSAGWPSSSRHVLTLQDGTEVSEVSVLVPAGTTRVDLTAGADSGPSLVDSVIRSVPWTTLEIDGRRFPLTNATHFTGWHRFGRTHATATMHRTLGAYGAAEWWWDVRADGGVDLELLWHRATPGPDVRFTSATLSVAGGLWSPVVVPPACAPPYLARPRADGARHVIPQQMGMAWWIHLAGPREVVGVADWSRGGYMPSGFPVALDTPHEPYAAKLADARWRLATLQPSPSWGSVPTSPLWPASGALYGGEGGGDGRLPLDGVQWATSAGDADALEFTRIEMLRDVARARIRLDPSGGPIEVPSSRTWTFANGEFLQRYGEPGGRADSPWEFDRWPVSWAGAADPRQFAPHDDASMVRGLRHAWTLTWLANDPLAHLLTIEGATRALLTFAPLASPSTPGIGTNAGAREAQSALAMAAARCLGWNDHGWADAYVAHMRAAQMPSGCFTARAGEYPSENEPFAPWYPDLRLQGGEEFALTTLALYTFGATDAVLGAARGAVNIQTDDEVGDVGWFYFAPTGMGSTRYADRHVWPAALSSQMGQVGTSGYYTFHSCGYAFACALAVDAPECDALLLRTFGTSDRTTVRAIVRSWGVEAPSEYTSAPIENYWPLLGVLP